MKFFQKEPVASLRAAGVVDARDEVVIDSGIVFMHMPVVQRLLDLATVSVGGGVLCIRSAAPRVWLCVASYFP